MNNPRIADFKIITLKFTYWTILFKAHQQNKKK